MNADLSAGQGGLEGIMADFTPSKISHDSLQEPLFLRVVSGTQNVIEFLTFDMTTHLALLFN